MSVASEIERIKNEISSQSEVIDEIITILDNKASANPSLQEKTVTPNTVQQEVIPDAEYDGLSKVVVSGDANLIPENIKDGVSIFGILGALTSIDIMFKEAVTETYTVNPGGAMDTNNYDEIINLKSLPYLPFVILIIEGEGITNLPYYPWGCNNCAIYVRQGNYSTDYTGIFNDEHYCDLDTIGRFAFTKNSDGTYDLDGIKVYRPYMLDAGTHGGDKYTAILIGRAAEDYE